MNDIRLISARRLEWIKDVWRQPAFLALNIRILQDIVANENEDPASRTEAAMLIKKLYAMGKEPPRG